MAGRCLMLRNSSHLGLAGEVATNHKVGTTVSGDVACDRPKVGVDQHGRTTSADEKRESGGRCDDG